MQPARAWLGSLIAVTGSLGLSEHLVRTACNRLAKEGWLQSHRRGRRSYYRFSDYGARQYRRAAYRIYAPRKPEWDGYWTILFTRGLDAPRRGQLERQLGWLGFGRAGPDTLVRAGFGEDHLGGARGTRHRSPGVPRGKRRPGQTGNGTLPPGLGRGCAECRVRAVRRPLRPLANEPVAAPGTAFQLRLMLIHHYRRIVLTDPELPSELLPGDWLGNRARDVTAELYHRWLPASDAWLADRLELEEGAWPAISPAARSRFRDETWTPRRVALA